MQDQQTMNVETALRLIDQVCAQFQGNRVDHINLQVAVQTLRDALPQSETASEDKQDEEKKND